MGEETRRNHLEGRRLKTKKQVNVVRSVYLSLHGDYSSVQDERIDGVSMTLRSQEIARHAGCSLHRMERLRKQQERPKGIFFQERKRNENWNLSPKNHFNRHKTQG
jgi:hypothetical protein